MNFESDPGDGGIYGFSASYAIARLTSSAYFGGEFFTVGQAQTGGAVSYVYRSYLKFDTSPISPTATILQVNLRMVAILVNVYTGTDFDIQIIKCDWSAFDPVDDTNRENVYDLILSENQDNSIWRNTSGMAIDTQYTSGNLDTDWINKDGYTYYGLRSSRDFNSVGPSLTRNELVRIGSGDNATEDYRPALIVSVEEPGAFVPRTMIFFDRSFDWGWRKKDGLWQPQNPGLVTI
ncbi:MAG TPA: hypothetical protein PLL88_06635 [Anaerolineaceae bacterium]|mgnify:CR=1 FL=1|nr:hypothetical protein [Anaerolineaceae bacterium]